MINNITPRTAKPDALTSLLRSDLPDLGEIQVSVVETSPARLGEAAARVVRLRARITPRIVPAAELAARWHRPSRGALLARLASEPEGFASLGGGAIARVDTTDGVRATFANGDILHLRLSGNAPELRCYAEADTVERASKACAARSAFSGASMPRMASINCS